MSEMPTIRGKHKPDPAHCIVCFAHENDPLYQRMLGLLKAKTVNEVEHGEEEEMSLG